MPIQEDVVIKVQQEGFGDFKTAVEGLAGAVKKLDETTRVSKQGMKEFTVAITQSKQAVNGADSNFKRLGVTITNLSSRMSVRTVTAYGNAWTAVAAKMKVARLAATALDSVLQQTSSVLKKTETSSNGLGVALNKLKTGMSTTSVESFGSAWTSTAAKMSIVKNNAAELNTTVRQSAEVAKTSKVAFKELSSTLGELSAHMPAKNVAAYSSAWAKAATKMDVAEKKSKAVGTAIKKTATSTKHAVSATTELGNAFQLLAAYMSIRTVLEYGDAWNSAAGLLRTVSTSAASAAEAQESLFNSAQKTRTSYSQLVDIYSQVSRFSGELGASQAQLQTFAEKVGEAFSIQHISTLRATSAIIQLGEAMSEPIMQMRQFNSLMKDSPVILKAVAEGMNKAQGSVGRLRSLVLSHTVTNKQFFAAFMKGSKDLDATFGQTSKLVSQGFTEIKNAAEKYIGTTEESLNANTAFYNILKLTAQELPIIIPALISLTVGVTSYMVVSKLATISTANLAKRFIELKELAATNPFGAMARGLKSLIPLGISFFTMFATGMVLFKDQIHVSTDGITTLGDVFNALGDDIGKSISTQTKGLDLVGSAAKDSATIVKDSTTEAYGSAKTSATNHSEVAVAGMGNISKASSVTGVAVAKNATTSFGIATAAANRNASDTIGSFGLIIKAAHTLASVVAKVFNVIGSEIAWAAGKLSSPDLDESTFLKTYNKAHPLAMKKPAGYKPAPLDTGLAWTGGGYNSQNVDNRNTSSKAFDAAQLDRFNKGEAAYTVALTKLDDQIRKNERGPIDTAIYAIKEIDAGDAALMKQAQEVAKRRVADQAALKKQMDDIRNGVGGIPKGVSALPGKEKKKHPKKDPFPAQLAAVRSELDPTDKALIKYQHDVDVLTEALKRHLILLPEYTKDIALAKKKYIDVVAPMQAIVDKLKESTKYMKLDIDARKDAIEVDKLMEKLKKNAPQLTDKVLAADRKELEAIIKTNHALDLQIQLRDKANAASMQGAKTSDLIAAASKNVKDGGMDAIGQDAQTKSITSGMGLQSSGNSQDAQFEKFKQSQANITQLQQQGLISQTQMLSFRVQATKNAYATEFQLGEQAMELMVNLSHSKNKKLAKIGKAAAIAQATYQGGVAIANALSTSPWYVGLAMGAVAAIQTGQNLARIKATPVGFKTGGEFTVGGYGSADSQQVSFRATPGERVSVSTPQQVKYGNPNNNQSGNNNSQAQSQAPVIKIVNNVDPGILNEFLNSPGGERVLVNAISNNKSSLKSVFSTGG